MFYKLDEYGKYKHPGLGINILPLQCEYGPKGKYLWNRMREEGWKRIYGKKGKWRNRRELGCIWMVRVLSLCGRGWLAKSIFRDLLRQPQDGAKTYVLRYFYLLHIRDPSCFFQILKIQVQRKNASPG